MARCCALTAMLAAVLAALLIGFESIALDTKLYDQLQAELDVYEAVGIDREPLNQVMQELVDYIQGKTEALDASAPIGGETQPAFNEREVEHMRDVRALFDLERTVRSTALVAFAVFLLVWLLLTRGRGCGILGRALSLAALIWATAAGALAFWAWMDFNAAFNAFHRALFVNDLWQLNPATDRMIRMFPEPFFMRMAGLIARREALILVVAGLGWLPGLLSRRGKIR